MGRLALLLVVLAGCAHESSDERATTNTGQQPASAPEFAKPPLQQPARPATRVELTAVTLADDCRGAPPSSAPAPVKVAKAERSEEPKEKRKADSARERMGPRLCEQTSMQLSIFAGEASSIEVKSVELFDEAGTSLGTLSASKPTRWSDASGLYETWDQTFSASSTSSVSYVLTQPKWAQIGDRWNRTYTLKAVLSVGGVDQTAKRDVTLSAPTSLPPNVKT
jgi:hypothetical protein